MGQARNRDCPPASCYCHWYASDRGEPIAGFLAPARELFSDWLRARDSAA